ncbi:transposase IstA domain protein [Mycobacterium kansasii 824]|nr:transposase IstA domain protein [Mycobacterium kansasii 824]
MVAAIDHVVRGIGGVSRVWRFDRMATVCDPGSGRVTASFAGVAKHYRVAVAICPPRRGQSQGCGREGQPHCRTTLVAHPG